MEKKVRFYTICSI